MRNGRDRRRRIEQQQPPAPAVRRPSWPQLMHHRPPGIGSFLLLHLMTPGGPQQQKRKPCAKIKNLKTLDKKEKKTSNATMVSAHYATQAV
jgi:hypothetical protein